MDGSKSIPVNLFACNHDMNLTINKFLTSNSILQSAGSNQNNDDHHFCYREKNMVKSDSVDNFSTIRSEINNCENSHLMEKFQQKSNQPFPLEFSVQVTTSDRSGKSGQLHPTAMSSRSEAVQYLATDKFQERQGNTELKGDGHARPDFARNDLRRKSTMKSIRRLIKRYLGFGSKGQHRELRNNITTSLPLHMNEPSTSFTEIKNLNGLKRDSRNGSFMNPSPNLKNRRNEQSSIRSKRNQNGRLLKSSSRTSLSHAADASWRRRSSTGINGVTESIQRRSNDSIFIASNNRVVEDVDSGVDSPVDSKFFFEYSSPCLKGIANIGNTCYINSVLQCLAAIESFAEYFVLKKYVKDLKEKNRLQQQNSHQFGTDGLITTAFANLLRSLWFNEPTDSMIRYFRSLIGHFNGDYRTSTQQDAQELLVWLLDKIHEDLNLATSRKYKDVKIRGSEEDLAESARDNYLHVHCSIITYLFGAQFRSSIQCKNCSFTKLNFDPYMCVSLQVPQDTRRAIYVTLALINPGTKRIRFGLNVERNGRIRDVKECLSCETNISEGRLIALELCDDGFRPVLANSMFVYELISNEISAIELPKNSLTSYDIFIIFVVVEVENASKQYLRLTQPYICVVPQYSSYRAICMAMLDTVLLSKNKNDNQHYASFMNCSNFNLRIIDEGASYVYLNPNASMPMLTKSVQRAVANTLMASGTNIAVLPLVMECKESCLNSMVSQCRDEIVIHQSCEILEEQMKSCPATLEQCLSEFSSAESIEWHCENCFANDAEKIMKFRSLPNILVFHFKRFRQMSDGLMVKLDRAVQFPIEDLEMSPYVFHSGHTPSMARKNQATNLQNDKYTYYTSSLTNGASVSDTLYINTAMNVYDLFAVVHHRGDSVNSGHYTATTKNPVDGKWRHYDDHLVRTIDRIETLNMSTAYLLFYENRAVRRQFAQSSSGHSSTESGNHDHWFNRIHAENMKRNISNGTNGVMYSNSKSMDVPLKQTPSNSEEMYAFRRDDITRRACSPIYRNWPTNSVNPIEDYNFSPSSEPNSPKKSLSYTDTVV